MTTIARPYPRRNVSLYYAYALSANFALWGGVWIKYLIDERGFELKWILAMDLPFWLLVAILQAPTGALADHIGRRKVLAIGGIFFSVTILGFGLTTNYWMLFFDYILWSVAMSMQSGADSALVYDSLKEAGVESRFSRIAGRGFALNLTAAMVGVALGGFLADVTSLAFVVQVSCIFPLIGVACALFMHEPPLEHHRKAYLATLKDGVRFAWRTPPVRYTVLIDSVLLTGTFGPVVLVQPFLLEHDVGNGLFGLLQAPLRLTAAVAAILAFRIGARTGMHRLLWMSFLAIFLAYVGLASFDATVAFALFAMPGFIQGLSKPVVDAYLHERTDSDRRATVLSLTQLCFAFQVAFFEPALGFITDDVSLISAFVFAAAYFGLLMPPLLFLWRRADRGEQHSAVAAHAVSTPAIAPSAPQQ
ncbi:hypothetical protein AYO38_04270 [bacterium SCGC AG-212-C10]|nr:hypothetical protein AYO38_04270 [bacterium SCGC AG-212-C10]